MKADLLGMNPSDGLRSPPLRVPARLGNDLPIRNVIDCPLVDDLRGAIIENERDFRSRYILTSFDRLSNPSRAQYSFGGAFYSSSAGDIISLAYLVCQ
jgi:hypothetical protein